MKVAFLGPAGTYSQEASIKAFGTSAESVFCHSLDEVVTTVARNAADGGVLPIENSTNGTVDLAVEALLQNPQMHLHVAVCGVIEVRVRHQLYSRATDLSNIKTVYSHPQVWGQVREWLAANLPSAQCIDTDSTAEAVDRALHGGPSGTGDPTVAALGGPLTATTATKCKPLVTNCADDPNNTTRFLILRPTAHSARHHHIPPRTTWTIASACRFADVQRQLADSGTRAHFIASRPAREPWKYDFLVEIDGPLPRAFISLKPVPATRL